MQLLRKILKYRPFSWVLLIVSYEKQQRVKIKPTQERINDEIQRVRCIKWFEDNGDEVLRLNYDLTEQSIVFDLGGYVGDFASKIYDKYGCSVYIFEPVPSYHEQIKNRFLYNPKIKSFCAGLADATRTESIYLGDDKTSLYGNNKSQKNEIKLVSTDDFFREHLLLVIDLIKINIEGGEYSLLEHLINTGDISRLRNIQVQFHDFVIDNAEARMHAIQEKLSLTHELTYQYPFVWENWKLKK